MTKLSEFKCRKCKSNDLDLSYDPGSGCPSCGYDATVTMTCLNCKHSWEFD